MSEDNGDKTEAPTAKRRTEAREQGNIARSQDLTAAVLLLGFLFLMQSYGHGLVAALKRLMTTLLSGDVLGSVSTGQLRQLSTDAIIPVAKAMAPILAGAMLLAVLINIVQVGFHLNTKRLMPNLAAANPLKGLGRLTKGPQFVQLAMNTAKMLLMGFVAYSAVHGRIGEIISTQQLDFLQCFALGAQLVYSISLRVGLLLLVLAIIDYVYQRFRVEKELKMTKQQIRDEMRNMDGDPKIKQRRRQMAYQMLQQKIKKDVPTADVVVTNPTEYAVALKYDAASMTSPRVVAKGRGYIAQQIREVAIAHGVPILERKPLARALYKLVNIGQEVPEQFYGAIAEILAYVYELTGRSRRKQSA